VTAKSFVVTGRGGQGVKLATELLAYASFQQGLVAIQYSVYGALVRGGDIASFLTVDSKDPGLALRSSYDFMLAMHNNWFDKYYQRLAPGAVAIIDKNQVPSDWLTRKDVEHRIVNFTALAKEAGSLSASNMLAAGYLAAASGVVSLEALEAGLEEVVPAHRRDRLEMNLRAMVAGFQAGRTGSEVGPSVKV